MKKSTFTYLAIALFIMGCGTKTSEKQSLPELSNEEVKVLESEALEADSLTKEIELSAKDLEEALKELEN